MAEQTGGERSIPATPLRRQRAREEGKVARSQDLSAAVTMLAALFALKWFGLDCFNTLTAGLRHFIGDADQFEATIENMQRTTLATGWLIARSAGPIVLAMLLAGTAINVLQVGLLFTGKPLAPKWNKINPFMGLQNLLSPRSLVELVKSVMKVTIVAYVVWLAVRGQTGAIVSLIDSTPAALTPAVGAMVFAVWWRVVLVMLALGGLDYGYQYWQHERGLMMTTQEAKQEVKEYEGDPHIKQRIRQIQRSMAMQRMMAEVPKADVIITNPVRFAVALRYEPGSMAAPTVVAKGARILAERIRAIATEHQVPIVQKPELARSLYKSVEVGQAVPEKLFRAVAEILAYVYEIDRRMDKRREREEAWQALRQAS